MTKDEMIDRGVFKMIIAMTVAIDLGLIGAIAYNHWYGSSNVSAWCDDGSLRPAPCPPEGEEKP